MLIGDVEYLFFGYMVMGVAEFLIMKSLMIS